MTVSVSFATEPPERATFHQLLLYYYNVMIPMNPPEIDAAREMGMKHVFADTLRGTVAMQSLYNAFGFREIDRYPESRTAISLPALQPELRYFRLDL